ncbi:MAG: hypothetical protein COY77_01245 [Candidatus Omnitrophica bacterium CG_4_10_14_0_8_um_filter_43_18]|nr:MAG: hypothetical protein AUJ89_02705 [Candidatus Omnitrophica bacterium CG1_02_43_210]PIY84687.1 MAG: hypothetical protein COY77_01245 [Candidatus Omnitrophica bacterium CG_4_10_14_0_8_um_filter_43_18]
MKDKYTEEFLRRLSANINLKKQEQVFESMLGPATWQIQPVKGESKDKPVERFSNESGHGFSMPLKQGNQLYGAIIALGFKYPVTDELMRLFAVFTETLMREVQKEMELTKLYDTIRPRAIALSTIHTVHRLISSTLDLDELMPRIARLCLQVMRAEVCDIFLIEPGKKKKFVFQTSVNVNKDSQKHKVKVKLNGILAYIAKTGASRLTPKRLLVPLIDEDVIGIIGIRNKMGDKPFNEFDKEILTTFAEQAVIAIRNAQLYEEQEKLTIGSIKALAAILDTRPNSIQTHSAMFVKLVVEVAKELNVTAQELRVLKYASLLHDAGKVMIPDEILKKQKRLTGEEFRIIKKHPIKGVQIVKPIEVLKPVIPIILYHHERFDGTGYPKGLKGSQIPLGSRIMSVVDAFVAMVSKQPYRECLNCDESLFEIKKYSGTQFDPEIVDIFCRVIAKSNIKSLLKAK